VGPGKRQRGPAGSKIATWIDDPCHSPGKRGLNDGGAVGVKTGSVDVGMAVNEQLKMSFPTNKRSTGSVRAFSLWYFLLSTLSNDEALLQLPASLVQVSGALARCTDGMIISSQILWVCIKV
jgi:hypothetical protein